MATATGEQRRAAGKGRRAAVPLTSHASVELEGARDPVALLMGQAEARVPELVPVRYGRMSRSPFAYFRGAALPMAVDLASLPTSGLRVQLCGDAHLANFGAFASPERRLVFDVNDFDETLPGPFEWDVKRLAASLVIAGRENGFDRKGQRTVALAAASAYRTAIRQFAELGPLQVWYARLDVKKYLAQIRGQLKSSRAKETEAMVAKARRQDSRKALSKLTTVEEGRPRFVSDPPYIMPLEDFMPQLEAQALDEALEDLIARYTVSLSEDRRHLVAQFRVMHIARKVVGVGSVGTRAWVMLLQSDDGDEPLVLQAKEAGASVLEKYAGESEYANQGRRVVVGQRLMQAVSDIFLGWERVPGVDGVERDFYVRQLRDWKFSFPIERMRPSGMVAYAQACAWTLARAHARTGDRIAIAGYLGRSDRFDRAITDFAETYADVNERDHAALLQAVSDGLVEAEAAPA
jgi:uncharacterized protein (DUF2252 family)